MKALSAALVAIIFLTISPAAVAGADSTEKCKSLDKKVVDLIGRYTELRKRRSELPQGVFDNDVSGHGGGLHKVLNALGDELGQPPFTRGTIVQCVGPPDAIRNHEQMGPLLDIYNRELRKAGRKVEEKADREYLVYFWRGWHDFMFFIIEDGVVVDHGWWFAYE